MLLSASILIYLHMTFLLDPGTDRVDANGRLGGSVGRLDRLYRLIDPFSTGSIPQKIDRLDRFSIDFRPKKSILDVFAQLVSRVRFRATVIYCVYRSLCL